MMIGPVAREPSETMARFCGRDNYTTLRAYWWAMHMSETRWNWLRDEMIRESAMTGKPSRVEVQGLGVIAGYVPEHW